MNGETEDREAKRMTINGSFICRFLALIVFVLVRGFGIGSRLARTGTMVAFDVRVIVSS